jgi:RNA polymerase sigma-70 factor, ECF subfamily
MSEPNRLPKTDSELASTDALDWGATLAAHERWLRRVVAARLDEPQAVDEVMQDVALAAVAQRSPLHHPARVAVWLYRLAVRHVLMYRRKAGRRRTLVDRYALRHCGAETDAAYSPLAWLVRDERQQLVQDALRRLPPRDAELLVLKYAEGHAARELAERLGVAVGTIEARLHRARRRLRTELAILAAEFEATDHDRPSCTDPP